ncbi:hypothetical protein SARC_12268, partial [Sphaeroforma arctica JP610]
RRVTRVVSLVVFVILLVGLFLNKKKLTIYEVSSEVSQNNDCPPKETIYVEVDTTQNSSPGEVSDYVVQESSPSENSDHTEQQPAVVPEDELEQNVQTQDVSKNAMLYMEPRQIESAMYVLNNFNSLVPMSWDLVIACSTANREFMEEKTNMLLGTRKVHFLVVLPEKFSRTLYNALFLKLDFWNQIPYETLMIFQSDSVLCANSPFRIEHFLKYNYLGCALGDSYGLGSHNDWAPSPFYGSGGLTIRNVEHHKACLTDPNLAAKRRATGAAEDVFFSYCVHVGPESGRAPNASVLHEFCTQQGYQQPSFGIHKFWDQGYRFAPSQVRKMVEHCPEIIPMRIHVTSELAWNSTAEPVIFNVTEVMGARTQRAAAGARRFTHKTNIPTHRETVATPGHKQSRSFSKRTKG